MCRDMGSEVIQVVAKYDYSAADDQELDIKKNEKLILLDDSKRWWKVQKLHGDRAGFVPSNYVKRCRQSIFTSLKNTLGRKKDKQRNGDALTDHSGYASDTLGSSVDSSSPAIAKYDYAPQKLDELSLTKGDRVLVIERSSDGWWRGKKDSGDNGWFPSNYVVEEDFSDSDTRTYASPAMPSNDSLNNLPSLEVVVALYEFLSSNPEELSFLKDERLEVIEKPNVDPEWWRARNTSGETGLIPRNYVQTLPLSTDSGFPPESHSNSSLS
ncbi:hypothetical protein CAPTEDRAFT_176611, partial [Capitella teleta]